MAGRRLTRKEIISRIPEAARNIDVKMREDMAEYPAENPGIPDSKRWMRTGGAIRKYERLIQAAIRLGLDTEIVPGDASKEVREARQHIDKWISGQRSIKNTEFFKRQGIGKKEAGVVGKKNAGQSGVLDDEDVWLSYNCYDLVAEGHTWKEIAAAIFERLPTPADLGTEAGLRDWVRSLVPIFGSGIGDERAKLLRTKIANALGAHAGTEQATIQNLHRRMAPMGLTTKDT